MVSWPTLAIIKASCAVTIQVFPFDTQRCPLSFGSWTMDSSMLLLRPVADKLEISSFLKNGEWELLEYRAEMKMELFQNDSVTFSNLVYTLVIQRRSFFYVFNLVLPCMVLLLIGIMTFYLPPGTGDKISLSCTILLTMVLFQLMIADKLPPTSDILPLLSAYEHG